MDHPLSKQILERQASLVHQREDHVADVAIRINGQCLPRGEHAGEATMSLVRLEHAPRPPFDVGMDFAPEERREASGIRFSRQIAQPLAPEMAFDEMSHDLVLPGRTSPVHPPANHVVDSCVAAIDENQPAFACGVIAVQPQPPGHRDRPCARPGKAGS